MTTAFAASSRNAAKHNCTSKLLILSSESPEEFTALHASLVAEYQPETDMQNETVDAAARAVWELRRIDREFDKTQEKLYSQQPEMSEWAPQQHAVLERMLRYRTRAERRHGRTLKSLEYLRTLRLRAEQRAFWESVQLSKLDLSERRLQQAAQRSQEASEQRQIREGVKKEKVTQRRAATHNSQSSRPASPLPNPQTAAPNVTPFTAIEAPAHTLIGSLQFERSATMGSIREARHAGMYPATAAIAISNAPTPI